MCSGLRSSSAKGAIALRRGVGLLVVDLEQQGLVRLDDQGAIVIGVPAESWSASGAISRVNLHNGPTLRTGRRVVLTARSAG